MYLNKVYFANVGWAQFMLNSAVMSGQKYLSVEIPNVISWL